MKASLILSLALSLGVLAATPAVASPSATSAVKVPYGDLDLSSPAGSRALDARVENALRRVCDFDAHERQLALKKAAARCIAASRTQIAAPRIVDARVAAR